MPSPFRFTTCVVVMMDPKTARAVRMFLDRVPNDVRYEKALLFGSRARGDYREDSDADVALIVDGSGHDWDLLYQLGGISFDVFADTGIRVQPVIIPLREWRDPEAAMRPSFVRNISKEGVAL